MYTVSIKRTFDAYHFLPEAVAKDEARIHPHRYEIRIEIEGTKLDKNGYLMDIMELEHHLAGIVSSFRGSLLNDLPEFDGINPSIEHFSRIICDALLKKIREPRINALTVILAESKDAKASYRMTLSDKRSMPRV